MAAAERMVPLRPACPATAAATMPHTKHMQTHANTHTNAPAAARKNTKQTRAGAHLLPALLLLGEGVVLVLPDERAVRVDDAVDGVGREGEDRVGVLVVEVVEEDAAEAARLAAVADEEVLVAPSFDLNLRG